MDLMGRLTTLLLLLAASSCSGGSVCVTPEFGCSDVTGVATPVATPDFAAYQALGGGPHELLVNGLSGTSCGINANCHAVGGDHVYQIDNTALLDSAEMVASHESLIAQFTCFGERNAADIAGNFADRFVNPPAAHQGISLSDTQLQVIRDWATTGAFPSYGGCP